MSQRSVGPSDDLATSPQSTLASSTLARKKSRQGGHAILELAFSLPWFFFLFIGAFDMGFYSYSLIETEDAARAAALYTSSSAADAADSTGACTYALGALQYAPNVGTSISTCTSLPVKVAATQVTGPDGSPASQVTVTYQSPHLVPIPALLQSQFTFVRTVEMRIRS